MKPNFALNLSEDGIDLLARSADRQAWLNVATVPLETDDLAADLANLRAIMVELGGENFACKLILPSSQLLYADIHVGSDVAQSIEDALEQQTPYTRNQLVYDVSGTPPKVQVVAVAKETLAEAEAFIGPYGLNPVGFTAIPQDGHFDKEPNLGPMPSTPQQGFTSDPKPMKVIPADTNAPTQAGAVPGTTQDTAPNAGSDTKTKEPDSKAGTAKAPPTDTPQFVRGTSPDVTLATSPASPNKAGSSTSAAAGASVAAGTGGGAHDQPLNLGPENRVPDTAAKSVPKPDPAPATEPVAVPEKPPRRQAVTTENEGINGHAGAATIAQKVTQTGEVVTQPRIIPPAPETAPPLPSPGDTMQSGDQSETQAPAPQEKSHAAPKGKPRYLGVILTIILLVALALFAWLSAYILPQSAFARWLHGGPETGGAQRDSAAAAQKKGTSQSAQEQAQKKKLSDIEAKRAYAVSGAWQQTARVDKKAAQLPQNGAVEPTGDPRIVLKTPPPLSPRGSRTQPAETKPAEPQGADSKQQKLVRPTKEGTLTPEGALVFAGKPPVEPRPRPRPDALALAALVSTISSPPSSTNPVLPSPKKADQPEENTDLAKTEDLGGDPRLKAIRPSLRPQTANSETTPPSQTASDDLAALQQAPQLASGLEPGSEKTLRLAAFRPDPRPGLQSFSASAAPLSKAQSNAIKRALSEIDLEDSETPEAEDPEQATALAIAQSKRPPSRPESLLQHTARAQGSSASQAAMASTAAIANTGPAVATISRATPTAPTRTSVARAATDNNAISLGKMALIGVFGSPSNRKALVRMPNGRFKKVGVGDRIGGGRVAAIADTQLKYKKSGRILSLDMP